MKLVGYLTFSIALLGTNSSKWEYTGHTGPEKWPSIEPLCGHKSQSPINIKTSDLYPNSNLGLLDLNGYSQSLSGGNFVNNGHTVQLNFPENKTFKLSGKGIDGKYTALQLHFHWRAAESTTGGSEHTVNGKHYQAEMHIVHIKDPFTNLNQIKSIEDGLAVIGVFILAEEDAEDAAAFEMLLKAIPKCRFKGDTVDLKNGPSLLSILPESGTYYRYSGSLTTPPCYESVLWTIYKEPVVISKRQLEVFQNLTRFSSSNSEPESKDHSKRSSDNESKTKNKVAEMYDEEQRDLSDNYRPVQDLNGRIVSAYYDIGMAPKSNHESHNWGYEGDEGPPHWYIKYSDCEKKRQSPIDLLKCNPVPSDDLKALQFFPAYFKPSSGHVTNNGHTIQYSLKADEDLGFGEMDKEYKVLQLHFHWGKALVNGKSATHSGGSEHTKNGYHYPVEMHIVHKKSKNDSNKDDDLAVLGVFFEIAKNNGTISNKAQEALGKITDMFQEISFNGQQVDMVEGPILSDLLPADKSYYRYMGSLTTPTCSETVMWTVLKNPLYITRNKFLEFQSLMKVEKSSVVQKNSTKKPNITDEASILDEVLLLDNYRPVQACNGRQVQVYTDEELKAAAAPTTDVVSVVVWSAIGVIVFCSILAMIFFCRKKKEGDDKTASYSKGYHSSSLIQKQDS